MKKKETLTLRGKPFNSKIFSRKVDAVEKANKLRKSYHGHIHLRVIKKKDGYQIYQFSWRYKI